MMSRHLLVAMLGASLALVSGVLQAQSYNAGSAVPKMHYYDIEDFGLDAGSTTYADDIAPILQRSCQQCHRPGGGGPMSFMSYDEVRPWAPVIQYRTAIRDRMGAMPPWFVEKNIGINGFKNDYSLSDLDLALIQDWVEHGAPRGNPDNEPTPLVFS
ncbi:MAG: cytochrome c, partial [Gammaproteobacteria bacterium]|nr:cytochrome c [Gammaproteobacteria bacterium]